MRKARSDSRLKSLSAERQREIYELLQTHSLRQAEAILAQEGVKADSGALCRFRAWYPTAAQLRAAANLGDTVKEILREVPSLKLNEKELCQAGQAIFEAQAVQDKDSQLYVALRRLRQDDELVRLRVQTGEAATKLRQQQVAQKEEQLRLARQRFQRDTCRLFLQWHTDEKAREIAASGGSNAEKIEALGRAMFEDWDEE